MTKKPLLALATLTLLTLAGCGNSQNNKSETSAQGSGNSSASKSDAPASKTDGSSSEGKASSKGDEASKGGEEESATIYVKNYQGGYGTDWLNEAKARFEKLHPNVEIKINNVTQTADDLTSKILDGRDEVYFTEQSSYFTLKSKGLLGDITDAVTTNLSDTEGSIESKMDADQKSFYGIEENGSTHYYAVPHYAAYFGITYNIDLFDDKKFYFAANPTGSNLDDYFITNSNGKKSSGPDGVSGTSDDGLPTTYDEFFKLCEYIVKRGCTPFLSNGHNYKDYLTWLLNALTTTYEGKEEMRKVYTLDGSVNNLATIEGGSLKMDANPTTLSTDNGYETARMAGRYHALNFLSKIYANKSYRNGDFTNTSYSHTNAQDDFLMAGEDGSTKPIAMLSDGIWWQNEAKGTFDEMVSDGGEEYSAMNRHFGFMPLPQPTQEKANEHKSTLHDILFSFCFMKSNVEESKKPIVKEFIRFCNTDESLKAFTISTNTPKALNYSMSEEELSQMTAFGQSVFNLKKNSDIVYPCASSSFYQNNQKNFEPRNQFKAKDTSGAEYSYATEMLIGKNASPEDTFEAIIRYYKESWKTKYVK